MQLIKNTKLAAYDCNWCSAVKGVDVHTAACPVGERYKQVQQLGGVPWPIEKAVRVKPTKVEASTDEQTRCLECGKPVEEAVLACDECLTRLGQRRSGT